MIKELGLEELNPIDITILLVDRSHLEPNGVIEDMLTKVGKFIIPTDFIILDFETNRMPVIDGHPFLSTFRTMIDIKAEVQKDGNKGL